MNHSLYFYKRIFASTTTGMVVCDDSGQCIEANEAMGRIIGGTREDVLSQNYNHMKSWEGTGLLEAILDAVETKKNKNLEVSFSTSLGRQVSLDFNLIPFAEEGQNYLLVVVYDITQQKNLEKKLGEEKKNLEEVNAALRIILREHEFRKTEIEEKVFLNIQKLLLPYLSELASSNLDEKQHFFLDVIQKNIQEITSSFAKDLTKKYNNLTPREIQVANLIKQGRTNKEIAKLLTISPSAVDFHRQNLRKKLSIKGEKKNLRSILLDSQF